MDFEKQGQNQARFRFLALMIDGFKGQSIRRIVYSIGDTIWAIP